MHKEPSQPRSMPVLSSNSSDVTNDTSLDLPMDPDLLEETFNRVVSQLPVMPVDESSATETLYDVIKPRKEYSIFLQLVEEHPRLVAMLKDASREYTVFLPQDSGWKLDPKTNKPDLGVDVEEVLSFHISPQYVTTEGLLHMPNVPTILLPLRSNGPQIIRTRVSSSGWHINKLAHIVKGNTRASNGVIHSIDKVLLPPPNALEIMELHGLGKMKDAIYTADLEPSLLGDTIKGKTIYAPTDEAFRNLGEEVLHFLFDTEMGKPYLQALVKLHICPDLTFFTNLIWPKNNTGARQTSADAPRRIKGKQTQLIQTMLTSREGETERIGVAIARFNGLIALTVNGTSRVVEQDLAASDGVVQVIDGVLLPPDTQTSDKVQGNDIQAFKRRFASYLSEQ